MASIRQYLSRTGLLTASDFVKLSTAAGPSLRILDASWFLPNNPRNAYAEFLTKKRLAAGTRFADIDAIKDETSPYPHMLPSTDVFNAAMQNLDISAAAAAGSEGVVVYDTAGNFSAPRLAWMLEVFGYENVALLDNFVDYEAKGYSIDTSDISGTPAAAPAPAAAATSFKSQGVDQSRVISFEELEAIVQTPSTASAEYLILDARPAGRFSGTDPEPRPGLSSGHVPTSVSLPFNTVLDASNHNTFLSADKLRGVFAKALKGEPVGERQVVAMCGTGVTACVIERAIRIAGITDKPVKVYDGSWT